jgi:hypothetical protein
MELENEPEIINDVIDNIIEEQQEEIKESQIPVEEKPKRGRPATKEGKSKSPEVVKQYNKERYQRDREKLLLDATQKYFCRACNKEIAKGNKSKHEKTGLHHENMIELQCLVFQYFKANEEYKI